MTARPGSEPVDARDERPGDADAIRRVVESAFGQPQEAALVDALRRAGAVTLSLVAVAGGDIVGHILFSPVTIRRAGRVDARVDAAVGLAPLAVAPEHQRRGVGSRLVRAGLDRLRAQGHAGVVVLGHPSYYPRFGFVRASALGLRWDRDVPDEAFMALELQPGALAGPDGVVSYRPELDGL